MATSVEWKVPLLSEANGQELWCIPCSREGKESSGHTFCFDCQEYFCELCTRFHQAFPALKDHRFEPLNYEVNKPLDLEVNQPSEWNHPLAEQVVKVTSQPDAKLAEFECKLKQKLKQNEQKQQVNRQSASQSEKKYLITQCPLHNGENLTVYCKDHENVGCHVCAAISHRQCRTVTFLPEASAGFANSKAKKDYMEDINNTLKNIQNTKTARTRDKQTLSQKSAEIISSIQRYKERIIEKLEKIEAESIKAVMLQTEALSEKIQDDMDKCDTMFAEIKDLQTKFSVIDKGNDLLTFIEATKGRDTLNKGKKIPKGASAAIGKENLDYTIGASLETFLNSLNVFGRMAIRSNNPALDNLSVLRYKDNTFNSKMELELSNRTLGIRDYCEVSTKYNAFIVAKKINDILFVQDNVGKVKNVYTLSGKAFGICSTGPSELAVTIPQEQAGEVQFFTIRNGISYYLFSPVKKVLKFSHPVYGIACHQENLFIGDKRQVNVCDMNGAVLYKIYEHGVPNHITVSPDGKLVYIADFFAGIIIMTRAGEVKKILKDKYLDGIHGVSVDDHGNVYAAGYFSSSVVKFDGKGTRRGVYITKSDLSSHPIQIYKKKNDKLVLVSGFYMNKS